MAIRSLGPEVHPGSRFSSIGVLFRMRIIDYPIPLLQAQANFCKVSLNRPIGEAQRIRPKDDKLICRSEEIRLFGVNLGYSELDNRGAFEFLASIGVNLIRITMPYRIWGATDPVLQNPAPVQLRQKYFDRLCKQQKICEELGIYILVREFSEGLGSPYYTREEGELFGIGGSVDSCALALWHKGVRELVMKRLQWFLTVENPYTRRPFGASPAILGIQLTNESGLFGSDLHLSWSARWKQVQRAPQRVLQGISEIADVPASRIPNLGPEDRLNALAFANGRAYDSALKLMEKELGNQRPLLIADNSQMAGPASFVAFNPCDAYAINIYPRHGMSHSEPAAQIKPFDLSPEGHFDRLQVRLGDKPTIITEAGEVLAAGGQAFFIADFTTRCASWGYSAICFHAMYKGIYGEKSGEPAWLTTRVPRENFELSVDPGALCAMQAASLMYRKGLIPNAPRTYAITESQPKYVDTLVSNTIQLEDFPRLAFTLRPELRSKASSMSNTILLFEGPRNFKETQNPEFSGNVERKHVKAGGAEIEWGNYEDPTQDWVFMRAPLRDKANIIVIVGRAKPDGAFQTFSGGTARVSGFRSFSWPDPKTGFGDKLITRRPKGPQVRVFGKLHYVEPDGKDGGTAEVTDKANATLPDDGIRFVELL